MQFCWTTRFVGRIGAPVPGGVERFLRLRKCSSGVIGGRFLVLQVL